MMLKKELEVNKYYITGMRQRVKLLTIWGWVMELLYHTGTIRTTPISKPILDYMVLDEDQTDNHKQAQPFIYKDVWDVKSN